MADDQRAEERGRWKGRIEATQEAQGKRITRLETAMIAMMVYLASRAVETVLKANGI